MFVELLSCLMFALQGLYSFHEAHDLFDVCVTWVV